MKRKPYKLFIEKPEDEDARYVTNDLKVGRYLG